MQIIYPTLKNIINAAVMMPSYLIIVIVAFTTLIIVALNVIKSHKKTNWIRNTSVYNH